MWAKAFSRILGAIISMDQHPNVVLSVFQSDFFSGVNIPSMPIRVELNIFHWLLVWG